MKPFTLLVKPVSFDCNLRCEYCFYLRTGDLYLGKLHRMSDAVLEEMTRQMMSERFRETVFAWQGGEPTLAGVDFFRRAVDLQQKHGRSGQVVGNGLQTNATLIDDDWARFLAEFRFLVGVSIDGPKEIHNRYRRKPSGAETFHLVLRGLEKLRQAGVAVNAVVLVSRANVRRAALVYRFLRDQRFDFLQFIPCVERDPVTGRLSDFAVSGVEFGDFLLELFDAWKSDNPRNVSIRDFDAVRRCLLDGGHDLCTLGPSCDGYLLVEHTGDVYPCDFFVRPEWRLGNLLETSLAEMCDSPLRRKFSAMKSAPLKPCEGCEWVDFCHGGCMKDRLPLGDPATSVSELCAAWRRFLPQAVPFFRELAADHPSPGSAAST